MKRWHFTVCLLLAASGPSVAGAQLPQGRIGAVLNDMAARGSQFDAGQLHALERPGLSALLDWLLPGTAEPRLSQATDPKVAVLVAQLGAESYRTREAASQRLYELGSAAQAALVEAARSRDAEVSWRATRILRAWEGERHQDMGRYVPAFAAYLSGIHDKPRLDELVRRARLALEPGMPYGGKLQIITQCLTAIARTGNDEYVDGLRPLLKHRDPQVALLVIHTIGSAATDSYYPPLLLEALQSGREELVRAAIDATPNCRGGQRAAEVQRALTSVFQGNNEALKFRACRPLITLFDDRAAFDYVLEQAAGKPPTKPQAPEELSRVKSRQFEALACLADPRNRGKPLDPAALKVLQEVVRPVDGNLRMAVVNALATYSGEDVARALLPYLGDAYPAIPREVARRLLEQPDKKMLRRVLAAAAKDDPKPLVRQQAESLLRQIGEGP